MARPISYLLTEARRVLGQNQRQLAEMIGSSLRTVQRWETQHGRPDRNEIQNVADAVRPHDVALADEIDTWAPRPKPPQPVAAPPPEPPAPPPPPPPLPIPDAVLVDSVVCAAAEAMSLVPQAIRPAVLAAFTRARDARLTPDAVVAVLARPAARKKGA